MRLKISARKSDLARLQAYRVGDALKQKLTNAPDDTSIEYNFRASLGDMNLTDPLWKMPEKGVFTEDFLNDLISGETEMVVHSWKDLPTEPRTETEVVSTLPRADIRDLLLFRKDRLEQARASGRLKVLTSSPRRIYNLDGFLKNYLPFEVQEIEFESVRGNIQTRMRKFFEQDADIFIVAKAALDRLLSVTEPEFFETRDFLRESIGKTLFMVVPLSLNPAAAAQGALAIEVTRSRRQVAEAARSINCEETFSCVSRERKILASYGGGCHQKIGVSVLRRPYGEVLFLRGLTDAGEVLDEVTLTPSEGFRLKEPAQDESAIFPRAGEQAVFFTREACVRKDWEHAEQSRLLWVARETAWPEGFKPREDAIIWTAGLATWRKLAERGVWVSGSSEGLGVQEDARIEMLIEDQKPVWLKLTHLGSHEARLGQMMTCGTYRLKPNADVPDLRGRTHFFWMSGSSFERALELYPEIKNAHHASGPGLTHDQIVAKLGTGAKVSVHLDIESWREAVLKG